jgi:hypothetical protein
MASAEHCTNLAGTMEDIFSRPHRQESADNSSKFRIEDLKNFDTMTGIEEYPIVDCPGRWQKLSAPLIATPHLPCLVT